MYGWRSTTGLSTIFYQQFFTGFCHCFATTSGPTLSTAHVGLLAVLRRVENWKRMIAAYLGVPIKADLSRLRRAKDSSWTCLASGHLRFLTLKKHTLNKEFYYGPHHRMDAIFPAFTRLQKTERPHNVCRGSPVLTTLYVHDRINRLIPRLSNRSGWTSQKKRPSCCQ